MLHKILDCFKYKNLTVQNERRLLILLICYGILITLLHLVNFQTIFLIQPKTLQFIQKNSVYLGSRCFGCDELIQNGVEKKNLFDIELLLAIPSQGLRKKELYLLVAAQCEKTENSLSLEKFREIDLQIVSKNSESVFLEN